MTTRADAYELIFDGPSVNDTRDNRTFSRPNSEGVLLLEQSRCTLTDTLATSSDSSLIFLSYGYQRERLYIHLRLRYTSTIFPSPLTHVFPLVLSRLRLRLRKRISDLHRPSHFRSDHPRSLALLFALFRSETRRGRIPLGNRSHRRHVERFRPSNVNCRSGKRIGGAFLGDRGRGGQQVASRQGSMLVLLRHAGRGAKLRRQVANGT